MRRAAIAIAVLAVATLTMAPSGSCGFSSEDREVGETCTRSSECVRGLHCEGGVCRAARDGGVDAGASDADVLDGDGNTP